MVLFYHINKMNKIKIGEYDFFYYDSEDPVVDHLKQGYLYGNNNYHIGMHYLKNHDGAIVDCGAHIGTFSFAPVVENRTVLMIEAADKNVECLKQTFTPFNNAIIEHSIVLDTIKSCDFSHDGGPFGSAQINNNGSRKSTTVDELCVKNNIDKVCFIKYDIEGYEIEALLGSQKILEKNKPLLILEVNGHCLRIRDKKPYDMFETLEELGYYSFLRNSDNALIPINKNNKFPFCVMDIIGIHKDNLYQYVGDTIFGMYLNDTTIQKIIEQNVPRANNECQEYFKTITE